MLAKILLLACCTFFFTSTFSQKKIEHYYNYYGRECIVDDARYYSLEVRTDSGWYKTDYYVTTKKLQEVGLYEDEEDNIPNGTFYWFTCKATLQAQGQYIHGKKTGVWVTYYPDKSLKSVENFKDGHHVGISLSFYKDGSSRDSLNMDDNGNAVYVSWFDNGNPSSAGRYVDYDKQNGKWQYFHKNGQLSSMELYDHDRLVDKNYFDEDGKPMSDTASTDREAQFKGGDRGWNNYFTKTVHYPEGYRFKSGYQAVVTAEATINEDGKVIDAEITLPLNADFDKAVMRLFENCPDWEPAISHNRKVYGTVRESINFTE